MTELSGVVLCGGRSSRMGVDKATLDVGGSPLVLRVAARVAAVADPVLLAAGRPGRLGPLPYPEVADAPGLHGPLAGLVAGLEASPHALVAVVACDLPFASPAVLGLLASLRADEDAVVPVTSSGAEPLHALYARSALPEIRDGARRGRLAVRGALEALRVRWVGEDEWRAVDPAGRFAVNLNRVEDLALLGEP